MKTLHVASECSPFCKTGGLADVVGALPKALETCGVGSRVILPLYPALEQLAEKASDMLDLGIVHGGPSSLVAVEAEGLSLLFLDAPHLFRRGGGIYVDDNGLDWADNAHRFAALCDAAARVALDGFHGWRPDIVHVHDWQAGLVPWYLRQRGSDLPCVLTIHNIAFKGEFDNSLMPSLDLSPSGYTPDGYEFFGQVSYLKAGIVKSDRITTVSPTYARELMRPEFGMGLEGLLQARKADLVGILNGIDTAVWDPERDSEIAETYNVRKLKKKAVNRAALERAFHLRPNPDAPLFCVISRMTEQKGLDLLLEALPNLVSRGARVAVLGSGALELEAAYRNASVSYPGTVSAVIGYDEPLSHLLQAGADAILVPSRFEPCGLTQLYGLRYGTIPVVARTGGLADTVIDANEAAITAGCANGIQFAPDSAEALSAGIEQACNLFENRKTWSALMRNAMRHPVGWEGSALTYHSVYKALLNGTAARTGKKSGKQ